VDRAVDHPAHRRGEPSTQDIVTEVAILPPRTSTVAWPRPAPPNLAGPGSAGHAAPSICARYSTGITARRDDLAATITTEMGAPTSLARAVQVGLPIAVLKSYVDLLATEEVPERVGNSLIMREPVAWSAPSRRGTTPCTRRSRRSPRRWRRGCTIVHKPSEVAPLSAYLFAEIAHEAGLPAGVYNLVPATGSIAGEAIATHPECRHGLLHGSTGAGRRSARWPPRQSSGWPSNWAESRPMWCCPTPI